MKKKLLVFLLSLSMICASFSMEAFAGGQSLETIKAITLTAAGLTPPAVGVDVESEFWPTYLASRTTGCLTVEDYYRSISDQGYGDSMGALFYTGPGDPVRVTFPYVCTGGETFEWKLSVYADKNYCFASDVMALVMYDGTKSILASDVRLNNDRTKADLTFTFNVVKGSDAGQKGKWRSNSKGWWYEYPDHTYPSGKIVTIDGEKYAFDTDGYMVIGWGSYYGNWYYFKRSGEMVTGWVQDGSSWFYMDPSTGKMLTGFYTIDGREYYFKESGKMATGWLEYEGSWYLFNDTGAMQKGWFKNGSYWYYLEPSTGKMLNGFQEIKGQTYYFHESGRMLTDWVRYYDDWYYFSSSGAMIKAAWVGDYYVDADGAMVREAYVRKGSKYYWVNKNGRYTKTYGEAEEGYNVYDQDAGIIIAGPDTVK